MDDPYFLAAKDVSLARALTSYEQGIRFFDLVAPDFCTWKVYSLSLHMLPQGWG